MSAVTARSSPSAAGGSALGETMSLVLKVALSALRPSWLGHAGALPTAPFFSQPAHAGCSRASFAVSATSGSDTCR